MRLPILCLLALMILVNPISAETTQIHLFGYTSDSFDCTANANNINTLYVTDIYTNQIQNIGEVDYVQCTVPIAVWKGSSDSSHWEDVTYKVGAATIGTGTFGYSKSDTHYYVLAIFNDWNIGALTGYQKIDIVGASNVVSAEGTGAGNYGFQNSGYPTDEVTWMGTDVYAGGKSIMTRTGITHSYSSDYDEYYTFEYDITGAGMLHVEATRPYSSQIDIYNGFDYPLNESTYASNTPFDVYSPDVLNDTWTITVLNYHSNSGQSIINFGYQTESFGAVYLNQSSYTEPELIQIDAELIIYDFTDHAYTTYLQWRDDVGNWNTVSHVEYNESIGFFTDDPTKSITGDIDFYKYEIPLRLRAVLIDFNKNTYVSTTIAESNTVLYNPPAGALYLVTGTVVNADTDAVVSGATVSVTGPMTQSDTTNVNGRFYLYLADGTYTFNTTKSGYEDNVDTGIIINSDTSGIEIPLVPVQTDEGVIYGTITDSDTKNPLNDVHVIFSNATDTIHAYSASNGYYEAEGFNNDSVYAVRALKTGYYSYNGSITTETSGATHKSFDMVQTNYSATPIPTSVSTYPGGEGYEWTNDDIVTMLRILVPGIFLMMLIFLLLAVMMGFMPNNGGNQGGNSGLGELWRRK